MTSPANIQSIEKTTGKSWQQWVDELDAAGARDLPHIEIARRLYQQLEGKLENHT